MKKLFALLLAVAMLTSMATIVSAAELTTTSTTTLTTTVQPASYTLNIPSEYEIDFGDRYEVIGSISITGATGFAAGKNIKVAVSYEEFTSEAVSTTIPFALSLTRSDVMLKVPLASGDSVLFKGLASGEVQEYHIHTTGTYGTTSYKEYVMDQLVLEMESADWGKALAGDYSATITYTAEVVAG
jgi:type 1 fimbria pilin